MILERRQEINRELRDSIEKTLQESTEFLQNNLDSSQILDYKYTTDEAEKEMGLEADLVNELVEDYVIQIIKSKTQFLQYIQTLQTAKEKSIEPDYTMLRELSHKNLGVAKNLRIKDAIHILNELMKKDDLAYLTLCVKILEACAIRLNPKCAYKTLKLIDIKNSLTNYFKE